MADQGDDEATLDHEDPHDDVVSDDIFKVPSFEGAGHHTESVSLEEDDAPDDTHEVRELEVHPYYGTPDEGEDYHEESVSHKDDAADDTH